MLLLRVRLDVVVVVVGLGVRRERAAAGGGRRDNSEGVLEGLDVSRHRRRR